ncbi:MAG: hypothetical protein JNK15_11785 [Planctomycetes bacterium]|nr:hypothetical protein [Planctomycetota bacterium]
MTSLPFVAALVGATAVGLAQGPMVASLVAVQPIVCGGSAGLPAIWPAGPLTAAAVAGPVGHDHAEFTCSLHNAGDEVGFDAMSMVVAPASASAATFADLLLTVVAASAPVQAVVEVEVEHWGDTPAGSGMVVDLGNDNSPELATFTVACCGTKWRHHSTWSSANGPLFVRVQDFNPQPGSPQVYVLSVKVRPCAPGIQFAAPACPELGSLASVGSAYYTNYALVPMPAEAPYLTEWRATGLGNLSTYVVGDQPGVLPLALPLPFTGSCDVFGSVIAMLPGTPIASAGPFGAEQPVTWSLLVPPLPPGFTFWLQHVSATWSPPGREVWGASNRVRYDT